MPEHPLDECPSAIAPLWPCNYHALRVYALIATGLSADLHIGAATWAGITADLSPDEAALLLQQCNLIHASAVKRHGKTANRD